MRHPIGILSAILLLTFTVSCEPDWNTGRQLFVVEGTIESGGHPLVILTRSISPTTDELFIEDCLVYDADVSVSDGTDTVVLSPTIVGYFPFMAFTTKDMVGEVGKTYTLDVWFNDTGEHLTAVTGIPAIKTIDSLAVYRPNPAKDVFGINAFFTDNTREHSWYQFLVKDEKAGDKRFYPSDYGTIDSRNLNRYYTAVDTCGFNLPEGFARLRQSVCHGTHVESDTVRKTQFDRDATVWVKLATMDSISYEVWRSLERSITYGEGVFASTDNVKGNVNGGLGYWCGFGVSIRKVVTGQN